MLIILVLQDQFSYDSTHKNLDRIYRVQSIDNRSKIAFNKYASTTWPLAKELVDNYPFVENVIALNTKFYSEGIVDDKRFSFDGLAIGIMLSAAFNYTNLSIARSLLIANEYGIRKLYGASGGQLVSQILTESVLFSLISLIFAVLILPLLVPAFSGMKFMTMLKIDPHQNIISYVAYTVFAVITGLFAGIIPAIYVSSLNPIKVFKSSSNIRLLKRVTFRKILLVAQYTFSIIFIISIILLYRQMNFMLNSELGFDKDVVYNIELNGQEFSKVRDQFSQLPEVESISAGSHIPGIVNSWGTGIKIKSESYWLELAVQPPFTF
jgi:putative ABC transport system permease protein